MKWKPTPTPTSNTVECRHHRALNGCDECLAALEAERERLNNA